MSFTKEKFPYRERYYTKKQIYSLVQESGFKMVDHLSQSARLLAKVDNNPDGLFHIIVAEKI